MPFPEDFKKNGLQPGGGNTPPGFLTF